MGAREAGAMCLLNMFAWLAQADLRPWVTGIE